MYVDLEHCLVCDGRDLVQYLDFGIHPPANSYSSQPDKTVPSVPLQLMFCKDCSHSQLSTVTDPEVLFSNYIYVSGTTLTLREHFYNFAQDCKKRFGTGKNVLEIGCNDGSCLVHMQDAGFTAIGVDPAENLKEAQEANNVIVFPCFWGSCYLAQQFDIIYGMNVFAHNLNPVEFLKNCLMSLVPGGTLILEMPYALNMYKTVDFGQVYSEHQQFFIVKTMYRLLKRVGMAIVDITESDVHGGSIRFFIQHAAPTCEKATNMIRTENALGMGDIAFYDKFRNDVMINLSQLMTAIGVQLTHGYKLVGYGAAAKLSTLISSVGPTALPLEYVIDDNPLKCGRFIPNTDIPIVPSSKLAEEEEKLCILFGAHNFREEIGDRLRAVRTREQADTCLHWVPKVEVEDLFLIK